MRFAFALPGTPLVRRTEEQSSQAGNADSKAWNLLRSRCLAFGDVNLHIARRHAVKKYHGNIHHSPFVSS